MFIRAISLITLIAAMAPVAFAQDAVGEADKTAGQQLTELVFSSIDSGGDGFVTQGDLAHFSESVFLGMDADNDKRVTYEEFSSWDPGYISVAEQEGNPEAFTTAMKIVFAFWDRNGDGAITQGEFRYAMDTDFRRADINNDLVLTEEEFMGGFGIIVALRAAIRPDR